MKNKSAAKIAYIFLLSLTLVTSAVIAQRISSTNYIISRESINTGGGNSSSSNYFIETSIEPVGGNASSANYGVCIGLNCCPADIKVGSIKGSTDIATTRTRIDYAIWQSDICMGTTTATVICAADCNPCTQSCTPNTTTTLLTLTNVALGDASFSITNPNETHAVYCVAHDDTYSIETCFNSLNNLTVTVEAGGPYVGTSQTVVIFGNTTYSDGSTAASANVTIDVYRQSDLAFGDKVRTANLLSSVNGKYSVTFASLSAEKYRVNVTAALEGARANATDLFEVASLHANCNDRNVSLGGNALDSLTGEPITSGTVTVVVKETGDRGQTAISNGQWSLTMVTCVRPEETYTLGISIVDASGKTSYAQTTFKAPS